MIHQNITIFALLVAFILAPASAFAGDRMLPDGEAYSYVGDGVTVTVCELSSPSDTALLRFEGNKARDFDGLVILHKSVSHDGGRRFTFDSGYRGGYSSLFSERGWFGSGQVYFQDPERKTIHDKTWLSKHNAARHTCDAMLKQHRTQKAAGLLKRF